MASEMKEELNVEIGSTIGMVMRRNRRYELLEVEIRGIMPGISGGTIIGEYMPTPYRVNQVVENTAFLLQNPIILIMKPFLVTPELRERICNWMSWANENPDRVQNVIAPFAFGKAGLKENKNGSSDKKH